MSTKFAAEMSLSRYSDSVSVAVSKSFWFSWNKIRQIIFRYDKFLSHAWWQKCQKRVVTPIVNAKSLLLNFLFEFPASKLNSDLLNVWSRKEFCLQKYNRMKSGFWHLNQILNPVGHLTVIDVKSLGAVIWHGQLEWRQFCLLFFEKKWPLRGIYRKQQVKFLPLIVIYRKVLLCSLTYTNFVYLHFYSK